MGLPAVDDQRIGSERTRILYSNIPAAVAAAGSAALLLLWMLVRSHEVRVADGLRWSALALACLSVHPTLWLMRRRAREPDENWRAWLRWFRLGCLAEGLGCVVVAAYMVRPDRTMGDELFVVLVAAASVSGALPFFAADLWAYGLYLFLTMVPHLLRGLGERFVNHDALAFMTIAFTLFMWWIARRTNAQLVETLRLRFENVDLLKEVSRQKTIAEDANAAKSQFLAAASHDLRQPLHALSLVLSALKARRMDGEARRLLDLVGRSVAGMDGLFAALLDMTRLDAGATKVELESFALRPLLQGIGRELRAEAETKGLRLTVRCSDVAVRSDPVLVERILRNLIANAVRYTDRGGVLVACRRTGRSDRARIEVWDTGRGIAEDQRTLIFREFYQVGATARDQAQGLGLGLAIVQRTAALLDCPLSLASRPGRGSVFKFELPRVASAPAGARLTDLRAPQSGLILVIDQEPAVREAMQSLLGGWGHQVLSAESAPQMLQRLDGHGLAPDLIICDWELGSDEDGVQTIESLRAHVGAEVPALLVSGDIRPPRIAQAQAAGLLLLHKPVTNSRLRAAVGNLMRRTAV